MADTLAGFPYRRIHFDGDGRLEDAAEEAALHEGPVWGGLREAIVICHGWNNDHEEAERLYRRFLEKLRAVLGSRPGSRPPEEVGVVGVLWPSKLWADDADDDGAGGAAGLGAPPSDGERVRHLKGVFDARGSDRALRRMAALLDERPADADALREFHRLLGTLLGEGEESPAEDADDLLLDEDPLELFGRLGAAAPASASPDEGGAAGLGDPFKKLWSGAREALRAATYWKMKARAGRVGREGLGPLIARWQAVVPELRVHLIGHSFGARVVSYSLAGLAPPGPLASSPVASLVMLQGAFSHFAFAKRLPHRDGAGALAGMQSRVAGPIVVTHTLRDTALSKLYTVASLAAREDAAAAQDRMFRWGAMGHDGAQSVGATAATAGPVGTVYGLKPGSFLNLDCNAVIVNGGGASGAHSDLHHPELAWVVAGASGLAGR